MSNIVKENKIGTFTLQMDVLERYPEVVMQVMSKLIVVRAEFMFHSKEVEYMAYSNMFEHVTFGSKVPKYNLIVEIKTEEDAQVLHKISVERKIESFMVAQDRRIRVRKKEQPRIIEIDDADFVQSFLDFFQDS